MTDTTDAADVGPGQALPLMDETKGLATSFEVLLYALLTVVALALRLYRPDWMPLDPAEASVAWPAWMSVNGGDVSFVEGSPLLFQAERLVFWLFGGGEAVARFVPALTGAAVVALAYRLRGTMGHAGALGTATLLALSPLWIFFGRDVAPAALAAFAIVLLIGSAVSRFPRDAAMMPIAAALALAVGGLSYAFALAAGAFAMVRYASSGGRARFDDDVSLLWPTEASRRMAAVVFAVTLVVAVTGVLTQTSGLAALVQYPAQWATQLFTEPLSNSFGFLLSLAVYAPVIVVLGVPGTVLAARRGSIGGSFLVLWVLIGLLIGLIGGAPTFMGSALLPLTLAAGYGLGRLVEATANAFRWQEDGVMVAIVLIVLAYAGVQMLTFSQLADAELGSSNWMLALGALGLAVLLLLAYSMLWGRQVALRVAVWSVVIALGVLALSNGTSLNYRTATSLREPMRATYSAPGAHALADGLAQVSWHETRDPNTLQTVADPSLQPNLAWPLRERRVEWAPVADNLDAQSFVVPSGTTMATDNILYRGQTHIVGGVWSVGFAGRHDFVRWLFHRRPSDSTSGVELSPADLYIQITKLQEGDG